MIAQLRDAARRSLGLLAFDSFPVHQEAMTYHCPLTGPRRRNLALQIADVRLRRLSRPHVLHVGVTTYCNMECPACPTGTGTLGRPAEHLDFEVYRRTLDELRDTLMLAAFWDWGEPLMHPRFSEMIAHATALGVMSVVSTNGTAANSERHLEQLVAAQPSVMIVCVDGADQKTFEKYRVGGELRKVLDTARRLVALRERLGLPYPLVEFRTLAMKHNEHQLPQLLAMAEDCGSDLYSVKSLRPYDYRGNTVDATMVPVSALSRYQYAESPAPETRADDASRGPLRCAKPHFSPTLNSSGELMFCSYATHDNERFGDVGRDGFEKVWTRAHARAIRGEFQRRGGVESCQTCYFRSDHRPTMLHQVPLRAFPPALTAVRPESREQFLETVRELGLAAAR